MYMILLEPCHRMHRGGGSSKFNFKWWRVSHIKRVRPGAKKHSTGVLLTFHSFKVSLWFGAKNSDNLLSENELKGKQQMKPLKYCLFFYLRTL